MAIDPLKATGPEPGCLCRPDSSPARPVRPSLVVRIPEWTCIVCHQDKFQLIVAHELVHAFNAMRVIAPTVMD